VYFTFCVQDIFVDNDENSSELLSGSRWFDGTAISESCDGLVSDCMMLSDFMSSGLNPHVQSEHSYSVTCGNNLCTDIKLEPDNGKHVIFKTNYRSLFVK